MTTWAQTICLFPGQGSQEVGMGADIAQQYPAARQVFEQADALLGFALSKLCWEGPEDDLADTYNTQPALYVTSMAAYQALESEIGPIQPAYMAGHSLGEITALAAAGAISFADGLRLVRERGRLMKQAGEEQPGAMAAILGLDADAIESVCQQAASQTGKPVVLANDNCPGQSVISGDVDALTAAMDLATEAGAKRVVKLAVSIASHSPLMAGVTDRFKTALEQATFQTPRIPVIGNVTAKTIDSIGAIEPELSAQLTSPVRWTESMQFALAQGVTRFVEIGSKDVLSGLMRRIDRKSERISLNSAESLGRFAQSLNP
jgi:[acyl-carrier-protein] S-malonyltransferase